MPADLQALIRFTQNVFEQETRNRLGSDAPRIYPMKLFFLRDHDAYVLTDVPVCLEPEDEQDGYSFVQRLLTILLKPVAVVYVGEAWDGDRCSCCNGLLLKEPLPSWDTSSARHVQEQQEKEWLIVQANYRQGRRVLSWVSRIIRGSGGRVERFVDEAVASPRASERSIAGFGNPWMLEKWMLPDMCVNHVPVADALGAPLAPFDREKILGVRAVIPRDFPVMKVDIQRLTQVLRPMRCGGLRA